MVISMLTKPETPARERRQEKEICETVEMFKASFVFALVAISLS